VICIYNCDAIVRPDVAGDRLSIMHSDIPARVINRLGFSLAFLGSLAGTR